MFTYGLFKCIFNIAGQQLRQSVDYISVLEEALSRLPATARLTRC